MVIPVATFKAKCAESVDAVHETRQPLTITKYGRAFVQVTPCDALPADPIGFLRGTVVEAGHLVAADHDSWLESGTDPLLSGQ